MTAPPSARRFYRVLVVEGEGVGRHATMVLETRSGPAAVAEAEARGGWVEGDDWTLIWPQGPYDNLEAWTWATMRRWSSR